ncbi:hypothetical protein CDD82_7386 [Ophiocordyceps australis]|uniref:Uncharacterized protein n=1 Tax=Ophiocordyceps australis TaxID=1399860 RepID=A0A2C5XF06_9HYPO|nr:hypothetical protein CDD82_7386 [Ophiocordyceps australis]
MIRRLDDAIKRYLSVFPRYRVSGLWSIWCISEIKFKGNGILDTTTLFLEVSPYWGPSGRVFGSLGGKQWDQSFAKGPSRRQWLRPCLSACLTALLAIVAPRKVQNRPVGVCPCCTSFA